MHHLKILCGTCSYNSDLQKVMLENGPSQNLREVAVPFAPRRSSRAVGDGEYNVERIVANCMKSGRVEYLVKWQGYATKDNTWAPIVNLQGCEEAIGMFETLRRSTKMAMPPSEKQSAFMSKLDTAADAPAPSSARASVRFSVGREKQKILGPAVHTGKSQ